MVFNNALLSASCPPASQPHKCTHIHTISLPLPHSLCLTHTHTHTHTQTPCEARFTTFLPNWAFEKKFVEDKSHVIVVTKKVCLLWKKKKQHNNHFKNAHRFWSWISGNPQTGASSTSRTCGQTALVPPAVTTRRHILNIRKENAFEKTSNWTVNTHFFFFFYSWWPFFFFILSN